MDQTKAVGVVSSMTPFTHHRLYPAPSPRISHTIQAASAQIFLLPPFLGDYMPLD